MSQLPSSSAPGAAPQSPRRGDLALERIPPQDADAEMALLGTMLLSRDAVGSVIPIIGRSESAWLYRPAHQRLFELILDLYDDPTKVIELVVVKDELLRRGLLEEIGGVDYLVQLAESFSDIANAEHYARLVRGKGMLRDLIRASGEIAESAYAGIEEPEHILDLAEQKILRVTERRVSGQAVVLRDALERIAAQIDQHEDEVSRGVATGFVQLDEMLTGLHGGELIVVAGRPSMGKTALGLTIMHHMAFRDHQAVAFFSMEMSVEQVVERLICLHASFDAHRLRKRHFSEGDRERLHDVCDELSQAPLYIDDTPAMSPLELRAKARRLWQRHQVSVVVVDYLQLMHFPGAENRQAEIASISRNLKGLARELNIPVVALAQLNRMPEGRQDKRPLMSDLRESGAIEQDADVVLLIHRDDYYKPDDESVRGKAEIIVSKQRNGPTGVVELSFDRRFTRFGNLYQGPEPVGTRYGEGAPF